MKIAIVENEKKEVDGAFSYLNSKYYAGRLEFHYFKTSQDFLKADLVSFSGIVIDIHLTPTSHLDGFGLISRLLEIDPNMKGKIIVLTGFHKIQARFSELNLPEVPIVIKPANFNKLLTLFETIGMRRVSASASSS